MKRAPAIVISLAIAGVAVSLPLASWYRAGTLIDTILTDPSYELPLAKTGVVEGYVAGHWLHRAPWVELSEARIEQLSQGSIDLLASGESYLFQALIDQYRDRPSDFAPLLDHVVRAVNSEHPGAGAALHQSRAQLGEPHIDRIDLERIMRSGTDMGVIVVCVIAFDADTVIEHRDTYSLLFEREDVPERLKGTLRVILDAEEKNRG